jgi:prepilin-type N-terminal cleavage/methylation domain-containing protein
MSMTFHHENTDYRAGFSLVEVIVAIGVMSIAGTAILELSVKSMKANKSNALRMELQDVKRTIENTISCEQTLGTTRPTTCSGPQILKDKLGKEIAPDGKLGSWTVEAVCESIGTQQGKMGLSIYATKKRDDGTFMIDPLRGVPLDRKHSSSALFDPATRLCGGHFTGTTTASACPNGIKSINFEDHTVVCAKLNIAPCPSMAYVTGVTNDVRTCGRP